MNATLQTAIISWNINKKQKLSDSSGFLDLGCAKCASDTARRQVSQLFSEENLHQVPNTKIPFTGRIGASSMSGNKEKRYKKPEEVILPPIPLELAKSYRNVAKQLENMLSFPMDLLGRLYRFMDEYNKFIATFAVCEKGCSACCSIPVNMSRLEAEYIYQKTGYKVSHNSEIRNKHSPCPFLGEGNVCSIYEYRPYNCRTFHTLDNPKYCSTSEAHAVYGISSRGYNSEVLSYLAAIIRRVNNGEYRDIRHYFSRRP